MLTQTYVMIMIVEYKACIPQYEKTVHQCLKDNHWGMRADNLLESLTERSLTSTLIFLGTDSSFGERLFYIYVGRRSLKRVKLTIKLNLQVFDNYVHGTVGAPSLWSTRSTQVISACRHMLHSQNVTDVSRHSRFNSMSNSKSQYI